MQTFEISLVPNVGGLSESVAVSAVSAQSSVFSTTGLEFVNLYSTIDVFMRMGTNPTALATGVDQYVPGGNLVRVGPIPPNYRLAFIAAGAGTVYITKES